ncbi:MAG: ribonuclease PH [Bdellovibrionales bacterium]|nr:ribonuclease PH [Bdellovibrionales bacterium]
MNDTSSSESSFSKYSRKDLRQYDQLRKVTITPHVVDHAEGSVLIAFGNTRVLCTASVESKPPPWLFGTGQGWVTAEYGMLPRSTNQRIKREKALNGGRSQEISRLIGRSLRACVDLKLLGEKQIIIDCDVLNADGGTRTASITGGYIALALALNKMKQAGDIKSLPLKSYVAAISVGLDLGTPLLDLNYEEDSKIHTDMNFVLNNKLQLIEIQGTAEGTPFSEQQLSQMLHIAKKGCLELFEQQASFVKDFFPLELAPL